MPLWQRSGWAPAQPYAPPFVPPTPTQEAEALKNQIQFYHESIKAAEQRIAEIGEGEPSSGRREAET
jgi:hypothetical protein